MGTIGMEPSTTAGRAMGSQEVSEREAGSPTCLPRAARGRLEARTVFRAGDLCSVSLIYGLHLIGRAGAQTLKVLNM